jgi:N-acetylmuramoyl-L-alanine amidase
MHGVIEKEEGQSEVERKVFGPHKKRICLDPGHGGQDSGAIGVVGVNTFEKNINLRIAEWTEFFLKDKNYDVIATRRKDLFYNLQERVSKANLLQADVFVSIHCDAAKNRNAHGITVFHHPDSPKGKVLAEKILQAINVVIQEAHIRGVKPANFYVLKHTKMPAALVECGFLTNAEECEKLLDDNYRKRLGWAISLGITAFLEGL